MFDGSTGPDGGLVYDLRAEFPSGSSYLHPDGSSAHHAPSLSSPVQSAQKHTNSAKMQIVFLD